MSNRRYTKKFRAMGTMVEIDIVGEEKDASHITDSLKKIEDLFTKTEKQFSRFRTSSELQYVNAHAGAYVHVSSEFLDVLERAVTYYYASHGVFDPRIYDALVRAGYDRDLCNGKFRGKQVERSNIICAQPGLMRDDIMIDRQQKMVCIARNIDLSGIVKGWVVDRAKELIHEDIAGCIIDAGGDMWVEGVEENGQPWYIGIEDVTDDEVLIKIDHEGIATSGITRRQWHGKNGKRHHLVDPKHHDTFLFELSTVTVIADTVADADVWAKVLFLKGVQRGLVYANTHNIKAIFINNDNHTRYVSHAAEKNLV